MENLYVIPIVSDKPMPTQPQQDLLPEKACPADRIDTPTSGDQTDRIEARI